MNLMEDSGMEELEQDRTEWDDKALWEAVASWEDPPVLDDIELERLLQPEPQRGGEDRDTRRQSPAKSPKPERREAPRKREESGKPEKSKEPKKGKKPGKSPKPQDGGQTPKRPLVLWLAPVLLLVVAVAGIAWCLSQYTMVGFRLYPKNRPLLDLRDENISVSQYDKIAAKLPDCQIYWKVPFQGEAYPSDIQELTITSLSQEDVAVLDYFPSLKTVDAMGCGDYKNLAALEKRRPELEVQYQITLDGQVLEPDVESITLENIKEEELAPLSCLGNLQKVTVRGGEISTLNALRDYCHGAGIAFQVGLGSEEADLDTQELQAENVTSQELELLPLLPRLTQLTLVNPQADPETLDSLEGRYPDMDIRLEFQIGGKTLSADAVEIDLSGAELESLEQVEGVMAYLPKAETLFLGVQDGIPNEDMAAFRERNRENYKVVWEVRIGDTKTLRTDITYFMPGRDWARGPVFGDEISYNLRYCEDLISVDVGHLGSVKTVTWLEGLHNLEYLILAHTDIRSLEGIQACKKLKFLELDWTGIKDLTPLKECTALEDLNIGNAFPDITPLLEMPWLKNVYMIFGNRGDAWTLTQGLPDTNVVASGTATVSSGWRRLPNYYAMRDALHAYYMN